MAAPHEMLMGGDFGPVPATEEHVQELWSLVHSHARLQQAGYVLWPLSQADMDKKKRCGRCSKLIRKGHEKQKSRAQSVKLAPTMAQRIAAESARTNTRQGQASMPAHARSVSLQENGADLSDMMRDLEMKKNDKDGKETGPPMNCRYHSGRVQAMASLPPFTSPHLQHCPPCMAEQFHTTRVYRHGELENNWQYFATPHHPATPLIAVVLDCEMGTAASGETELIRVSAVDFFTRRVLVDSLVWPDVKMAHFNTRYSGVSRPSMEAAHRERRTLAGRAGAREALWRFVGPQTIVVGHSTNSDLNSLRWIHPLVIDTLLLEMRIQPRPPEERQPEQEQQSSGADAVDDDGQDRQPPVVVVAKEVPKRDEPDYPGLSLKALAAERLRRQIQIKNQGHDSLEDALATRDLLLWHMVNKPEPPVF